MANYVDIAIVAVVAFFAFKGLFKGVIGEVLGLGGLFVGLIAATRYMSDASRLVDQYLQVPPAFSSMLGYVLVFVGIQLGTQVVIHLLENLLDVPIVSTFLKLLGGAFGALKGGLIVSLVALLIGLIPFVKSMVPGLDGSKLYPYAKDFAPWVYNQARLIIPGSKSFYGEMKESLESVPTKQMSQNTVEFLQSLADEVDLPQSVQNQGK